MKTIINIKSGEFAGLKTVAIGHFVVTTTPESISSSHQHTVTIYNGMVVARRTHHKTAYGLRAAASHCVKICKNVSNVR